MKFRTLLMLTMVAFLAQTIPAQAVTTYKIAVGDPALSEQGIVALRFKEYLEEKSKGDVVVNNFYNCALGDETEALRNVQKGSLAFAVVGVANLVPFEKKFGVLTLPYIFSSVDEAVIGTEGKSATLLNEWAIGKGFRIIAWAYTDFRYLSNSVRPITKMEDMKGLKFRVPASAVLVASYEAFGGSPTPISWAETFTALQQGVVDGQDIGYLIFKTMKFQEANQKYIAEVHYTYQLQPLLMSERVFQELSDEEQAMIIEAGQYAQGEVLEYQLVEGQKAKQFLIDEGVQITVLEDEEKWKKAAYDIVWPKMADFVGGADVINAYLKSANKPEWKE